MADVQTEWVQVGHPDYPGVFCWFNQDTEESSWDPPAAQLQQILPGGVLVFRCLASGLRFGMRGFAKTSAAKAALQSSLLASVS